MQILRKVYSFIRSNRAAIGFLILAGGQIIGFHTLVEERESREASDCRQARFVREEQEAAWVGIVEELAGDTNNPRAQEAIEVIRDYYEELPPPSGCV